MFKGIKELPQELLQGIKIIGQTADNMRCSAFLVGGCVRDLILGVKNFDIDIAIEGDAIGLAKIVAKEIDADLTEHHRFGTAVLNFPKPLRRGDSYKYKIDLATARSENYEFPAALPKVSFSFIREDLFRRDFSINAMAIKINKNNFGRLIDYFNGFEDLKEKRVRVLHNLSILDDPTRILRAVRFEQRYNFRIEPHTLSLINVALKHDVLSKLKKDKIREELILILKEKYPQKCVKRMEKLCGLKFIYPKLRFNSSCIALMLRARKELLNFVKHFPHKRELDNWLVYFMALIQNLRLSDVVIICNSLNLKKGETKRVLSYFSQKNKLITKLEKADIKDSEVYRILEPLSYEVMVILMSCSGKRRVRNRIKKFLSVSNGIRVSINGLDVRALGLNPGPYFKDILEKVLYNKIDGKLKTREQELLYLKKIAAKYSDNNSKS